LEFLGIVTGPRLSLAAGRAANQSNHDARVR
jgi:hypothetical protein